MILQELILTDDTLQYCEDKVFSQLFMALKCNKYSSLTLLDFSRNIHKFNNNERVHKDLLKALKEQKSVEDPHNERLSTQRNLEFNKDCYLEQLIVTVSSEKILSMYKKFKKETKHNKTCENLRIKTSQEDIDDL